MRRRDFTARSKRAYGPPAPGGAGGSGFRTRQLAAGRKARRRRLAGIIFIAGIIVAAVIFLGVLMAVRSRGPSTAARESAAGGPGSGNVILVGRDEADRLGQLMVMVSEAEGGFSLYAIPPRTVAEAPGLGFQQLDRVLETGGQELLDQTVADLLRLPIQYHVVFTYPVVELVAEQPGIINLKTDKPLIMNTGAQPVTIPPGDNPTGSSPAVALLKAAAIDNRDGPRVQAVFYQGLRDALASRPEADRKAFARQLRGRVETDMDEDDFVDLFVAATGPGRPFSSWALPVRAAGGGSSWYFDPVADEIEVLLTGSSLDSGLQLEIQNGTDTQGLVEATGTRLEPLRYDMAFRPDPSGVNFDVTQIRCGSEALAAGNRVRDLLGKGTIIKDEYLEKQQIIVIIGRDMITAGTGQG